MLKSYRNTLFFLGAAMAISGCLGTTGPGDPVPIEDTIFASSLGVNLASSTRTANGAYFRDISVGTGAVVSSGQDLEVWYTGWLSSGQKFDSNIGEETLSFTLGAGDVIPGWDETIPGMRVGGKRQLIIPATLAYGPAGFGPIPGNAVIVFEVEIVAAN